MNQSTKTLVVLVSGSGTNLQAILDATSSRALNARVALVVSNRKQAFGLKRAESAGVPTLYFPLKAYRDTGKPREVYDADLAILIEGYSPDLVVLAGWMHVFSSAFLNRFAGKVINLHPALPNTFAGTDAIERAFEAHQKGEIEFSGCMMHYVIPEVDAGPVIGQVIVPFMTGDTLDSYEARMHEAEHHLIISAIHSALG